MLTLIWILVVVAGFLALAYVNVAGWAWAIATAAALGVAWFGHLLPPLVLLVFRAFRSRRQARIALERGRRHGDGSQLARPWGIVDALRDRRTEALLPAAVGEGPRNTLLCADESARRL